MHPIIQRIVELGSDPLTSKDIAYVLGMDRTAVSLIIKQGKLEAMSFPTRGGHNQRYQIAREALLRYLVARTTGDKAVLMASIRAAYPAFVAPRPKAERKPAPAKTAVPTSQDKQLDLFATATESTSDSMA